MSWSTFYVQVQKVDQLMIIQFIKDFQALNYCPANKQNSCMEIFT